MAQDQDFLDELISRRSSKNPAFPALVAAARERRRMLRELAAEREGRGLTQTQIAAAMGTSQSAVARIEAGKSDIRISSVERYAAALGRRIEWRVVPANPGKSNRRVTTKTTLKTSG